MSNIIEAQFIITKPLLKELVAYIKRFPFFDNKILPIFIFVYLWLSGYLAVHDVLFVIKDFPLHWESLPALNQLNIFFYFLVLTLIFSFPRLQYNLWKRIFLNSTYRILFKFDEKQVLIENQHESGVHTSQFDFSFFNDAVLSRNFLYLRSNKKLNTIIIFLKKDAITYADFQRLQEAIPCLQSLTVDPQQFKEEII